MQAVIVYGQLISKVSKIMLCYLNSLTFSSVNNAGCGSPVISGVQCSFLSFKKD